MDNWLRENYAEIFEPEILESVHRDLSCQNFEEMSIFSRLISAWIAFIFGDNIMLHKIIRSIDTNSISEPEELSLYYSLYSLCGDIYAITPEDKLDYAMKAEKVMCGLKKNVIYGNALLTLAQIYSERNLFEDAARYFDEAREIFEASNCVFLKIISDVNHILNLYKLGEYKLVIDKSEREIRKSSSFLVNNKNSYNLYKIYNLPIGMALLELGKYELALSYLDTCKAAIDSLKMFHLHGLIEWSRFKAIYLRGDFKKLKNELDIFNDTFSSLSSPFLNGIGYYYETLWSYETGVNIEAKAIEGLKLLLEQNISSLNFILVEMMTRLQLLKIVNFYKLKDIENIYMQILEYKIEPIRLITKQLMESLYHNLTDREIEILGLLSEGASNEEIGKQLFISTGTVKWHLNNIYSKLEVKNRVYAIEKYRQIVG